MDVSDSVLASSEPPPTVDSASAPLVKLVAPADWIVNVSALSVAVAFVEASSNVVPATLTVFSDSVSPILWLNFHLHWHSCEANPM